MANIQLSLFVKTLEERILQTTGWTLEPCWSRSQIPKFQCLLLEDGQTPEWFEGVKLMCAGDSWTPSFGENPPSLKEENVSSSWQILEDSVPQKYCLNPTNCTHLLTLSERAGMPLAKEIEYLLKKQGGKYQSYTWDNSKETLEKRATSINAYLTEELQVLNADTIRTDIPTTSSVQDVLIWSVKQSSTDEYEVKYEVVQSIKEGDQTRTVSSPYQLKVHVDEKGNMIIVQNPTLASPFETSEYEPKAMEHDSQVDADTISDATAFLETFFKLYPTATEKELAYYVAGKVMKPVEREYQFAQLLSPVFTKDGDNLKVKVSVKYLDNLTKAEQISQYELTLHKDSSWKVVGYFYHLINQSIRYGRLYPHGVFCLFLSHKRR